MELLCSHRRTREIFLNVRAVTRTSPVGQYQVQSTHFIVANEVHFLLCNDNEKVSIVQEVVPCCLSGIVVHALRLCSSNFSIVLHY